VRLSSIELGRLPVRAQAVHLDELIDGAVQSFEVRAREKGLKLTREIPKDLPCVMADPDRLTEILFNLLDNSIKFSEQGEIRVRATSGMEVDQPGEPEVAAEFRTGGDDRPQFLYVPPGGGSPVESVIVRVEDTGMGIPMEELPRVTERFFQGERKSPGKERGSGLGLAIVKHLVKLMGGQLSIQSKEGHGTTAKVILPAASGEDEAKDGAEET
jgi:signal transduction histidine kinase